MTESFKKLKMVKKELNMTLNTTNNLCKFKSIGTIHIFIWGEKHRILNITHFYCR